MNPQKVIYERFYNLCESLTTLSPAFSYKQTIQKKTNRQQQTFFSTFIISLETGNRFMKEHGDFLSQTYKNGGGSWRGGTSVVERM